MLQELQANGMVISGINFTATAVELWNADEIKPLVLQVPVTSNWVFEGGAMPTFHVGITNPYNTPMVANINMEISTDKMTFVTSSSKTLTLQPNNPQRTETMTVEGLQPGIYHATITVNDDLARGFFFAVRPTEIVSDPDKQNNFDSYWAAAKAQLAAVPINATLTEIPAKSSARRKVYLVEMQSIADGLTGDHVTIRGYYAEPTDGKKHPVLIHYQGYDSEYRPGGDSTTPWCMNANWDTEESANWAEFILSNRGQSVNNRPASDRDDGIQKDFVNTYGDWFAYQFGNKDSYYYRGAYMDCLRALDFMASRETSDMQNLFAEGGSQGGAFTVAAAALSDYQFKAIAPAITFMGDFPDYFEIVSWPGYVAKNCQAEINKNGGSMTDADMYAFLSYYDTKNLATSISCPIITSIGLQDNVCPPHTNLAPYNNVQTAAADKKVIFNAELQHATNDQWTTTYQNFFKQYLTTTDGIANVNGYGNINGNVNGNAYDLQGRCVKNGQ
jgi:cephalosporin-C deacetylase